MRAADDPFVSFAAVSPRSARRSDLGLVVWQDPEAVECGCQERVSDALVDPRAGHDKAVAEDVRAHYATDVNLRKRQRLWLESRQEPAMPLYRWVLDLVGLLADDGRSVVEIGCGNGPYLELVTGAVGVDLSLGMLRTARARAPRSSLVNADAQRLPFASAAFDVVLAPHMLYHVPDRTAAAHELRRILDNGGVCVAVTNSKQSQSQLREMIGDAIGNGWQWPNAGDAAFSLENGAEQLAVAFSSVEAVPAPRSATFVTDADLLADYVESLRDVYEADVPWISWDAVVAECRRRCASVIEREGAFRIDGAAGVFVCR